MALSYQQRTTPRRCGRFTLRHTHTEQNNAGVERDISLKIAMKQVFEQESIKAKWHYLLYFLGLEHQTFFFWPYFRLSFKSLSQEQTLLKRNTGIMTWRSCCHGFTGSHGVCSDNHLNVNFFKMHFRRLPSYPFLYLAVT